MFAQPTALMSPTTFPAIYMSAFLANILVRRRQGSQAKWRRTPRRLRISVKSDRTRCDFQLCQGLEVVKNTQLTMFPARHKRRLRSKEFDKAGYQ